MRVNLFTINSKTVVSTIVAMGLFLLVGCGQADQVKTISKQAQADASTERVSSTDGAKESDNKESAQQEAEEIVDGYFFEVNGNSITTDMDMEAVLKVLGDPNQYFEAASCAFNGLDKYYTYDHFEIDTYPDGDKDYISAIVLIDDIVSTPEGIALGSQKEDVVATYGEDFEKNGSSYVYTKGSTHLSFVFEGDTVKNISYDTTKLDD